MPGDMSQAPWWSVIGVLIAPGLMELQRMPYAASSSAMFFISLMTPCLAAT